MRIMSVDFGDSRTGIAVCDKSEMLASPLTVITEYNFQRCAEKVAELAQKEKCQIRKAELEKIREQTQNIE